MASAPDAAADRPESDGTEQVKEDEEEEEKDKDREKEEPELVGGKGSDSAPVYDDDKVAPSPPSEPRGPDANRAEDGSYAAGAEAAEDLGVKIRTLQTELQTHWESSCNSLQRALHSSIQTLSALYQDAADSLKARLQESSYWARMQDKEFWAGKAEEWKGEVLDRAEYAWDACWEEAEAFRGRLREGGINPLYLFSVSLLIVVVVFAGVGKLRSWKPKAGPVSDSPALRIRLPDGRFIAYREEGVPAEEARHQILVVHDFMSSRIAGIPGIDPRMLEEFGVRVVSYDRPGHGQSDPHPSRSFNTSAQDMVHVADLLKLGHKFWVLGYAGGGPHAWAAIKYIPERLAGVAMFAPMGNPFAANMTKDEQHNIWSAWTFQRQLLFTLARRIPSFVPSALRRLRTSSKPERIIKALQGSLGAKDRALIEHPKFAASWEQDLKESLRQGDASHVEEIILYAKDWGFSISELFHGSSRNQGFLQRWFGILKVKEVETFSFPVHIWQGTDDRIVPAAMNDFAKRMLPQVHLHKLESEGHFSFFCYCEPCHRLTLRTLFGEAIGPIGRAARVEKSDGTAKA